MPTRTAKAQWQGDLTQGKGTMAFGSGAFEGPFSFNSRMEEGPGTNPEELVGAAHAGCFSMQFSAMLAAGGNRPDSVDTDARVQFEQQGEGWAITKITLTTVGRVPGLDEAAFQETAEKAKETCPVSKALAGVEIVLDARLER
jgi:osmotically inducible protein OsmC